MDKHIRYKAITDETIELLALRLILTGIIGDVATGLGRDPDEYRAALKRGCADYIEGMSMDVTGDSKPHAEDVRTSLIEKVASILEPIRELMAHDE